MLNKYLDVAPEVQEALDAGKPVVALESTIISHGMPYPKNVETAMLVEKTIRENGAVPATIAVIGGRLKAGLSYEEIEHLGKAGHDVAKASRRDLPAFYTRKSGFSVDYRVDSPEELAEMFRAQRGLEFKGGMLVTNPIPEEYSMDKEVIDKAIDQALAECKAQGVHGKETTPFLLARVVELTGGDSLESNIQLVLNNARLAARTACALAK